MTPNDLYYETTRELFLSQRSRREQIRGGLGTPVAALAFSIYNLTSISNQVSPSDLVTPLGLSVAALVGVSVVSILVGSLLCVRVEWNFLYFDPPDLTELTQAEQVIRARRERDGSASDEAIVGELKAMLAGAYDIVYRRYWLENERGARARTRALRLIILALCLLSVSTLLTPFLAGGS